jgi:hypothetical protein
MRAKYRASGVANAALRAKPVVTTRSVSKRRDAPTMVKRADSRPKAVRIMAVGEEVKLVKARDMEDWLFILEANWKN